MAGKPRILTDGRDMIWTLLALLAVCVVVALVSGNCSVGLSGSASDDKTPAFDVERALKADARSMPFPIRLPATPEGWKPNSGSTAVVDGHRVSTVGWVSANGVYVQLSQTDGSEEALAGKLNTASDGTAGTISGTEPRQVADRQWTAYTSDEDKKFWITDFGDVRVAVMSRGPDADMEKLATAVATVAPLDPRR